MSASAGGCREGGLRRLDCTRCARGANDLQGTDHRGRPEEPVVTSTLGRHVTADGTRRDTVSEPKKAGIEFYGGYQVYSESGVDLTLLRENLKRSPTERLEANF